MQQYPPNNDPTFPGSQPQYPQQQPYPGQPYQQPPTPPPPPKKRRRTLLIVAIVVAVVLVACVSSLALASRGLGNTTPPVATTGTGVQPTTASNQTAPTSAPSGPQTFGVGQTVKTSVWQFVVHSIKASKGSEFNTPDAGKQFVLVDISVTNIGGQQQAITSLGDFTMRDSTGQSLSIALDTDAPNAPDGNVAANQTIRGTLAYQAPTSEKTFTLDFSDLASNDSASWSLHL